jgi:hypothetical protein
MPDYGHRLEFGYFLSPDAGDPDGRRRRSTCSARQIGIWLGAALQAGRDPA